MHIIHIKILPYSNLLTLLVADTEFTGGGTLIFELIYIALFVTDSVAQLNEG